MIRCRPISNEIVQMKCKDYEDYFHQQYGSLHDQQILNLLNETYKPAVVVQQTNPTKRDAADGNDDNDNPNDDDDDDDDLNEFVKDHEDEEEEEEEQEDDDDDDENQEKDSWRQVEENKLHEEFQKWHQQIELDEAARTKKKKKKTSEQQQEKEEEEVGNEDDKKTRDDDDMAQNILDRLCSARFMRDEGKNIQIRDHAHNIFKTFKKFTNDSEQLLTESKHVGNKIYALDVSQLYATLGGHVATTKQPHVAISGGIVAPNAVSVTTRILNDKWKIEEEIEDEEAKKERDKGKEPRPKNKFIESNVGDFTSLYPTTCQFGNICQSVASYDASYAIRIGNYVYDPFDKSVFNQLATPIKINKYYTAAAVFLIRPELVESAYTQLIVGIKAERARVKQIMVDIKKEGNMKEYFILDCLQNALKLIINTAYGILLAGSYPTYRPYLGSLVTYLGRIALVRFYLSFIYQYYQKAIDPTVVKRYLLGGDTDSLFLKCTYREMADAIKVFHTWPANRGVYAIDFEKNLFDGVFLGKKKYILYGQNLATGEMIFTTKGLFNAKYATPCKSFLANLLRILFGKILRLEQQEEEKSDATTTTTNNLSEIDRALDAIFDEFMQTSEENFFNRQIMSTDLHSLVSKNMLHHQMLEIEARDSSKTYGANFELISRHFDFCFWRNEPGVYGPLDPNNHAQTIFIQKFPLATALVEDNIEWYKANCPEFTPEYQKVSRRRMLMNDLGSPLKKLFQAFHKSNIEHYDLFYNLFSLAYKRNFGIAYQFDPNVVKPTKGSPEALEAAAKRAKERALTKGSSSSSSSASAATKIRKPVQRLVDHGYVQWTLFDFSRILKNKKK